MLKAILHSKLKLRSEKSTRIASRRHQNPDGSLGGMIHEGAEVDPTVTIEWGSYVSGPETKIKGRVRILGFSEIDNGTLIEGNSIITCSKISASTISGADVFYSDVWETILRNQQVKGTTLQRGIDLRTKVQVAPAKITEVPPFKRAPAISAAKLTEKDRVQ